MLHHVVTFLAANPYNITCGQIGCPTSTQNIGQGLVNITKLVMSLVGMLAIVALLVGGLQLAFSAGDSKRVSTARETILYAVVGLAVAIGAYAIVTFVSGHVK